MCEEKYPAQKLLQIRVALKFIIRDVENINEDIARLFVFAPEFDDELCEIGDSINYVHEALEDIQEKINNKLEVQLKNNKED